jgi:hypothetical protein
MDDIPYKHIDGNNIDDTYMVNNVNNDTYVEVEPNPIISICAILIIICTSLCCTNLWCTNHSDEYFVSDLNRTRLQPASRTTDQLKEYIVDNTTQVDNGLDCCICLDKFDENGKSIVLKCNHRFHINCIINWFEKELTCPLCRRNTVIK